MKIGIDIRTLMDKHYSGIPAYTFNLLKELFNIDKDNQYFLFYNSFKDVSDRIPDFKNDNVKVVRTRYPNKVFNYILQKIFKYPKLDKVLGGVDIFFAPHINFLSLSDSVKKVITIHDLSFLRYKEFFSHRKNIWHKSIDVKGLVNKFDKVIAISENTKRDLIELCHVSEDKIDVIYSGLSDRYKKISSDDQKMKDIKEKYMLDDKFILYLGTIEPRKNIKGIIKAYNSLRDDNSELSDVKLVLAGGLGWKHGDIIKEYEESKYKKDIKLLGYVNNGDKVYLYNLATVFLFPSFYEGFGFPPLEAMACGTPIITSISSSLPEVVNDAAVLINPYSSSDIASSLELVLKSEKIKEGMIEEGFKQSKKFNWSNSAKKYLEVFNKLKD